MLYGSALTCLLHGVLYNFYFFFLSYGDQSINTSGRGASATQTGLKCLLCKFVRWKQRSDESVLWRHSVAVNFSRTRFKAPSPWTLTALPVLRENEFLKVWWFCWVPCLVHPGMFCVLILFDVSQCKGGREGGKEWSSNFGSRNTPTQQCYSAPTALFTRNYPGSGNYLSKDRHSAHECDEPPLKMACGGEQRF